MLLFARCAWSFSGQIAQVFPKEPYNSSKEPCILWNEPYILSKTPYSVKRVLHAVILGMRMVILELNGANLLRRAIGFLPKRAIYSTKRAQHPIMHKSECVRIWMSLPCSSKEPCHL